MAWFQIYSMQVFLEISFKISLTSLRIPKRKGCEIWLQELFTLDGKMINNIKRHQKEAKQCRLSTGVV